MANTEPREDGPPVSRSTVEATYHRLRENILAGALRPGEKLRSEALKAQYEVGASTLREAMTRLVGEGLVISIEQRGFRVAPISLEDFADTSRTRKLIEVEALRQSIIHGDDEWESNVVAAYHHLSKLEQSRGGRLTTYSAEFERRNREFHGALIAACPSRWLMHLQGMLFQHSERYRRISLAHDEISRDVHAEHKGIMEAAMARNVEQACRLESEHIDRTVEVLSQIVAANASSL